MFTLEARTDADISVGLYFAVPYNTSGNGLPWLYDSDFSFNPDLGIRGIPAGVVVP